MFLDSHLSDEGEDSSTQQQNSHKKNQNQGNLETRNKGIYQDDTPCERNIDRIAAKTQINQMDHRSELLRQVRSSKLHVSQREAIHSALVSERKDEVIFESYLMMFDS